MEIDLVHASTDELDLAVHGDQLIVRVRDVRRRIALPDSVAGRSIQSAKLIDGVLEVAFEA
jgi:arsenite-transporting ATPase